MEYKITPRWESVINSSKLKLVGNNKVELLPLFCEGSGGVSYDITEVFRHYLFEKVIHWSFGSYALYCFSDRYDKPTSFFQIFYNDVLKTNEAVWRLDGIAFTGFRECFTYHLAKTFCKKRKTNIKKIVKNPNKLEPQELEKIFSDKQILEFINKLNKIKTFEIRNWLSCPEAEDLDNRKELLKIDVGELFFLLNDYKESLKPYTQNTDFEKFFPKSDCVNFLNNQLETNISSMLGIVIFRDTLNRAITENFDDKQVFNLFVESGNKFYKVLCEKNKKLDTSLHNDHRDSIFDIKSSSDPDFSRSMWIVKDVPQKIYFPEVAAETVFGKSRERFNSYLTRNVEYLDENLAREVLLNDAKLYVEKESLLKLLESQKKAKPAKSNHTKEKEFISYLKSEIAKSPDKKPLLKISTKGQNSYKKISLEKYQIQAGRFNHCWKEVTRDLPKNHPWIKAGAPKKCKKS